MQNPVKLHSFSMRQIMHHYATPQFNIKNLYQFPIHFSHIRQNLIGLYKIVQFQPITSGISIIIFYLFLKVDNLRYPLMIFNSCTLCVKQANINFTLTLLIVVIITYENWNILFVTAYAYCTMDLFLGIPRFFRMDLISNL